MSIFKVWRQRPITAAALWAVGALLVGGVLYLRYIGYPGGPIYTEVPAAAATQPPRPGTVAVFLSGDMGFNTGMGPKIAARIAEQGIPVLGVNSLTAFAHRRTPLETTALIRDAAARALAQKGAQRLLLVGQSFGADALVAGIEGLPREIRSRVVMVALVVPQDSLSYQATPGGVFSFGNDGPSLPAARRLDWVPVLCVHGQTEHGSLCPLWRQANVKRIALPGDHFLKEDSVLVAATVLHALNSALDR